MKIRFSILALLFLIYVNASAQDGYTVKQDSLQSDILKQNRKISIFLPEGYEDSKTSFPVVYVLDARDRDQHIVPTARFLSLNNKMPRAIIVGVINIDRNHDFLPDSSQSAITGGGADNFAQFFKRELIPYIDKNFKAEPFRVLVGHSYGGVFAMHAFLNDPDLFDAYIAIDPSFWYKNKLMIKEACTELIKSRNWKKSLFITGREGGPMKGMAVADMDSVLKTLAPEALDWKVVAYPDEDHGSVTFKSVYDGFRFVFDNGGNFDIYPMAGIIPKGSSTYVFIINNSPNLRYTLDGTEPVITSPLCSDTIKIDRACTLKVRSMKTKYKTLPTATRVFTEGEFMSGQKTVRNLKPGLKYSYYEGTWDSLPDFSRLTAKKSDTTGSLNLKMALRNENFAIQFDGYIHITDKALYNLWVTSDDGSKIYINNQLVLNNDGLHAEEKPDVKLVPLNPGYYPIRIEYFQKGGNKGITLGYVIGKNNPIPFPKERLFYK